MTLTGTLRHVQHILQIKTRGLHLKVGLPTYNQTHSTVPESCQRLTKDFYKANTALPTKTPTDFDKYVTAANYFTRTITVTNLLTPTITNKTTLNYTWQKTAFTKQTPHCRRKHRLTLFNTWLPPTISQERLQWRIYWHQLLPIKKKDDFELYVTKDRFYKANATLPTKTPTDFI